MWPGSLQQTPRNKHSRCTLSEMHFAHTSALYTSCCIRPPKASSVPWCHPNVLTKHKQNGGQHQLHSIRIIGVIVVVFAVMLLTMSPNILNVMHSVFCSLVFCFCYSYNWFQQQWHHTGGRRGGMRLLATYRSTGLAAVMFEADGTGSVQYPNGNLWMSFTAETGKGALYSHAGEVTRTWSSEAEEPIELLLDQHLVGLL